MSDLLATLDLNLLRTLDVLLEEQSVTKAATVLGRSQPAVSHALQRLRDALGDPLLVRRGRGLQLTPRAEALAPRLRGLLGELRRALEADTTFDPATARRTFRLACPDLLAPVVPDILVALGEAPGVEVELVGVRGLDALDTADVLLDVMPDAAPGVVARPLGTVTQCVAMRRGHPVGALDLDAYVAFPHVMVRTADGLPSLVERALTGLGRRRRVGLVVPNLLLAVHVVARSDLFFTGPRELLQRLTDVLPITLVDPPLAVPGVRVAGLWSQRHAADPGHRWFRRKVVGVARGALIEV